MKPFPFSYHRGDRQLARDLLCEHGLSPSHAEHVNPECVEVLAASNRLTVPNLVDADQAWRAETIDRLHPFGAHPGRAA